MNVPGSSHIQGWREIAACLGRDERTAKRWEKQRGLPVRRIPGGGRANVYLVRSELEAWLLGDNGAPTGSATMPLTGEAARNTVSPTGAPSKLEGIPETSPLLQSGVAAAEPQGADEIPPQAAPLLPAESVPTPVRPPAPDRHLLREVVFSLLAVAGVAFVITEAIYDRSRNWDQSTENAETLRPLVIAAAQPSLAPPELHAEVDGLFLEGTYLCEQRSPESLTAAKRTFEEAIRRDPAYAPAYGGLAQTYLLLREYATMPAAEAYQRASDAAGRALALDPKLSSAHAVIGFIDFFARWQAEDAAREFATAIRLDPSSALAHHWYGSMLMHQGRSTEALAELDRAQRLSPTSGAILATRALALGYAGHRAEGVRLLQKLEVMNPEAGAPHRNLAYLCLMAPRDVPCYLREIRHFAALRREPEAVRRLPAARGAYLRGGEPALWAETLASERALHPDRAHPTMLIAESETALGEKESAIADLSRMAEQRETPMLGLVTDPMLEPLQSDPRFRRIATDLGLVLPPSRQAKANPAAGFVSSSHLAGEPSDDTSRQIPHGSHSAGTRQPSIL